MTISVVNQNVINLNHENSTPAFSSAFTAVLKTKFCKGVIFKSDFSCTIMYKTTNCSQVHQFHLLMWMVVLGSDGCAGRIHDRSYIWKKHSRHLSALFGSGVQKQEQGCEGCCCHFEGPSAELWQLHTSWGSASLQDCIRTSTHLELLYVLVASVWWIPFVVCLKWLVSFLLGLPPTQGPCLTLDIFEERPR